MALIKQLVRGKLGKAAIDTKRKKIQAVIDADPAAKREVDELVGAKKTKSNKDFEKARIMAIRKVMRKNLEIATLIANAAKS